MNWSVEVRDDEWSVIDAAGEVVGSHASRAHALAQQRTLIQESLPSRNGGVMLEMPAPQAAKVELVSVPHPLDEVLVASVGEIQERLERTESILAGAVDVLGKMLSEMQHDRETFRQALTAAASQPTPQVTVNVPEQPVTVNVPEASVNVHVPQAQPPVVNVEVPARKRTVTIERDFTGQMTSAEIEEG